METKQSNIPGFLKSEDWLGVWIGFLIIIIILLGAWKFVAPPKMKWMSDGEFRTFVAQKAPQVDKAIKTADEQLKSAKLKDALADLRKAVDAGDRKAIGAAAKAVDKVVKEDAPLQQLIKADPKAKEAVASITKISSDISSQAGATIGKVFSGSNLLWIIIFGIIYLVLAAIGIALMGGNAGKFILGFPIVFILAAISIFLAGNYTINYYGIEYVIWGLVLGLILGNAFRLPEWIKTAVRTEFYIKTGLVIFGSQLLFGDILKVGSIGIIQTLLVISAVWYFCFWFARKIGVDDDFAAMLSSAVSICGVSAAIATGGAIKGDPKKLSYTVSLVVLVALPMIILEPLIAKAVGMPQVVAGAWIGGTLDSTPTVVAASAMVGSSALTAGTVVKLTQNVMIGVVAFILAVIWTYKKVEGVEKPGAGEIWERFPKFVLGFLAASILFSFFLPSGFVANVKGTIDAFRLWWFALAFVCIGLDTRFREVALLGGGRPALAFIVAQCFNIIWTLILAYLLFGGILFAAPKI